MSNIFTTLFPFLLLAVILSFSYSYWVDDPANLKRNYTISISFLMGVLILASYFFRLPYWFPCLFLPSLAILASLFIRSIRFCAVCGRRVVNKSGHLEHCPHCGARLNNGSD